MDNDNQKEITLGVNLFKEIGKTLTIVAAIFSIYLFVTHFNIAYSAIIVLLLVLLCLSVYTVSLYKRSKELLELINSKNKEIEVFEDNQRTVQAIVDTKNSEIDELKREGIQKNAALTLMFNLLSMKPDVRPDEKVIKEVLRIDDDGSAFTDADETI